jgi:hypothetical protein
VPAVFFSERLVPALQAPAFYYHTRTIPHGNLNSTGAPLSTGVYNFSAILTGHYHKVIAFGLVKTVVIFEKQTPATPASFVASFPLRQFRLHFKAKPQRCLLESLADRLKQLIQGNSRQFKTIQDNSSQKIFPLNQSVNGAYQEAIRTPNQPCLRPLHFGFPSDFGFRTSV